MINYQKLFPFYFIYLSYALDYDIQIIDSIDFFLPYFKLQNLNLQHWLDYQLTKEYFWYLFPCAGLLTALFKE